jgi:ferritin
MLNENVQKALNKQLNAELYSSYLYLAMAAYFESENLNGFAHWMKVQSREEYEHGLKIYEYIHQRNGRVVLEKIDAPAESWKTIINLFEEVFEHEQKVSESINNIVELTLKEKDYATNNFLQWFVSEQVEEEATSLYILDRVKLVGDNRNGIFLLDREMGQRAAGA